MEGSLHVLFLAVCWAYLATLKQLFVKVGIRFRRPIVSHMYFAQVRFAVALLKHYLNVPFTVYV